MIIGMIIHSFVCFYLNSRYAGIMINYNVLEQIKDITPGFLISVFIGLALYIPSLFINTLPIILLIGQLLLGTILVFSISEILKPEPYIEIKEIIITKFFRK